MPRNNKLAIWIEEILLTVVVAFTLWGAIKGAYIALIITAVAAFMMYRQWRILQAMNAPDDDEEEEDTESDDEDEE